MSPAPTAAQERPPLLTSLPDPESPRCIKPGLCQAHCCFCKDLISNWPRRQHRASSDLTPLRAKFVARSVRVVRSHGTRFLWGRSSLTKEPRHIYTEVLNWRPIPGGTWFVPQPDTTGAGETWCLWAYNSGNHIIEDDRFCRWLRQRGVFGLFTGLNPDPSLWIILGPLPEAHTVNQIIPEQF